VFVDIQADTFNLDPARLAAAVTAKTRAVIPVHLYGQPADMDEILAIAAEHGLAVIEDAAQAIGATYKGRQAGSMGTVGCLSFYPTKNLGAFGDGGMILTQDEALAERLAVYRNHGQGATYMHPCVGGNFRMDSMVAASLTVKLNYLDGWSARRRENAARYEELLGGIDELARPVVRDHNVSIFHQYVIRTKRRDELRAHLAEQGVATGVYYPLSLHEQECFAPLGYRRGDFPVSERAAAECLALPVHPELTGEQLGYVAEKIGDFFA
jgi:dTDP-4-amino-4,6-dideoxygalactose transaminase